MKSRSEVNNRKRIAAELRVKGWSQQRIADKLGVDRSKVSVYLKEMGDLSNPITDEEKRIYRNLQLGRIDALIESVISKALEGDLAAVDRVIRLEERRAKLLGLDAPVKSSRGMKSISDVQVIYGVDGL